MKIFKDNKWYEEFMCVNTHKYLWNENDNREETIDALSEDREVETFWVCSKCGLEYPHDKHTKYIGTSDTGPR